jgi:hypothetical protein
MAALGEPLPPSVRQVVRQAVQRTNDLLDADQRCLKNAQNLLLRFGLEPWSAQNLAGTFGKHLHGAACAQGYTPATRPECFFGEWKQVRVYHVERDMASVIQPAWDSLRLTEAFQKNLSPAFDAQVHRAEQYLDSLDIGGHRQRRARGAAVRDT